MLEVRKFWLRAPRFADACSTRARPFPGPVVLTTCNLGIGKAVSKQHFEQHAERLGSTKTTCLDAGGIINTMYG